VVNFHGAAGAPPSGGAVATQPCVQPVTMNYRDEGKAAAK
jgi:hypothetical protein